MGKTIRVNELKFKLSDFDAIDFSVESFEVSKDQDYTKTQDGQNIAVNVSKVDEEWVLTVNAGRHKTKEVATTFDTNITDKGNCIAHNTKDKRPNELNFELKGILTFIKNGETFSINDIVIAQGSNASGNNWWIGSPRARFIKVDGKEVLGCLESNCQTEEVHFLMFKAEANNKFKVGYAALKK